NQTTGAIVLDLITDSAGRPARIEIREAHHRLFALHLADPNATIASLPSGEERLQWLVNGRIPGASEAEPSKVPVHGVLLSSLGEVGVHVSQKAATLKITATNWDLGARTSLGMAVRASLGELARGRSYGMALVEPELSDPARDVQLKWYSAEAERLGMTQIILVPSVPTSPVHLLRLAGAVA